MRKIAKALLALLVLAGLLVVVDFVGFASRAGRAANATADGPADAVTALTGASDARILAGVKLAEQLKLPLLISGVHVNTTTADIAHIVDAPEAGIACCVTLGRAAATTEGNGAEVAEWARRYGFKRIIVVTSEYHMDRAMIELRRAMPEGEFIPHAVASLKVPASRWYTDAGTTRRLFGEWIKYRVASLRAAEETSAALAQETPAP